MAEHPAKLTWEDVQVAYENDLSYLVPASQKTARKGWVKLMEILPVYFPEAVDDPLPLIELSVHDIWHRLRNGHRLQVPIYAADAAKRLKSIGKAILHPEPPVQELDASVQNLNRREVWRCMKAWLEAQGWAAIEKPGKQLLANVLEAEKEEVFFTGVTISSVWQEERVYVKATKYKDKHFEDQFVEDIEKMNQQLGKALLKLLEAMSKNKNCHAALLVAGDKATSKAIQTYAPYIKKTGIHIYIVCSAKEVEEL